MSRSDPTLGFFVRVQQGIIFALLEDVWAQNFLNYFASPLTIGEYISGLIVTSIVTTIVGFGFIIIIAGILFGYNIFSLGLNLALFLSYFLFLDLALGILTSGICAYIRSFSRMDCMADIPPSSAPLPAYFIQFLRYPILFNLSPNAFRLLTCSRECVKLYPFNFFPHLTFLPGWDSL